MPLIDLSQFELYCPPQKQKRLSVSVMPDGTLRISTQLTEKLHQFSPYIQFQLHHTDTCFLIGSAQENNHISVHSLPKGGIIRAQSFAEALTDRGVVLPAKYHAEWDEANKFWLLQWDRNYRFAAPKLTGKRVKRPRKSGLQAMMP